MSGTEVLTIDATDADCLFGFRLNCAMKQQKTTPHALRIGSVICVCILEFLKVGFFQDLMGFVIELTAPPVLRGSGLTCF